MAEQSARDVTATRSMDRLATLAIWAAALLTAAAFLGLLGDLLWHGYSRLSGSFITAPPKDAGRAGGIGPILVSTLLILGVAIASAVPISLATSVLLAEFISPDSHFGRLTRLSLDVLAGVPSIVFGLFGNAFFSVYLGLGFSILSGGLTLACMILPILIRASEAGLRAVPNEWRQGAAALGLSRGAALWHILLPAATPGMTAGLLLGIGRAVAETAALIFTSGYVDRMPSSLFDSGRALAVHIYDLSMNVAGGDPSAYASALVLIVLLVIINATALYMAERFLHRRIVGL